MGSGAVSSRARTPRKASASRSKSPPKTRSKAKSGSKKSQGSRTPSSPPARRSSRALKKEVEDTSETDTEPETSTKDEETEHGDIVKDLSGEGDLIHPTTKLVTRIIYSIVIVVGIATFFMPEEMLKYISAGANSELDNVNALLIRAFAVSTTSTALQHIAAAQGTHETQKRSLQYGMFMWIMFIGLAVTAQDKIKGFEGHYVVISGLVAISLSIWACYFS